MVEHGRDCFRYYFQPYERFSATVELPDQKPCAGEVLNLSLAGLCVFLPGQATLLQPEACLTARLPIQTLLPNNRLACKVVRCQSSERGIQATLSFVPPSKQEGERTQKGLWRFLLDLQRKRIEGLRWLLDPENRLSPAEPSPDSSTSGQGQRSDQGRPERPRILIVDDDPFTLTLLDFGLGREGFQVTTAVSGEEAVALFRDHPDGFDLVFLDVLLPEMDGAEALEVLRGIDPAVRCCFITGQTNLYSDEELLERGAIHVFKKPLDPRLLGKAIRLLSA